MTVQYITSNEDLYIICNTIFKSMTGSIIQISVMKIALICLTD